MNDTQQKPFACTVKDCEMTFTNKDHLEWHQKKHDMMLNLGLVNKSNDAADQTPTPTRFIRNCEEVGLFQDLQNVNPFDEIFKKATDVVKNGGTLDVTEANNSDDTLHTPHILPHIEGSKTKTTEPPKQDSRSRSCEFTLGDIYSESMPENSPKSPPRETNLTETVKEKIIKTLQNKEKLKNDKSESAARLISVVPFQDLTAKKDSDTVINNDSGSENISSTSETKEKIREMNRAAQTRCRKRKQLRQRQMEEEICALREENKKLRAENYALKCHLARDMENNLKITPPDRSRSDKPEPEPQKQKKVAPPVISPSALPIIIHIGPNITSPTVPIVTTSSQPQRNSGKVEIIPKDDHNTKTTIANKKIFRKIIPKIRIDKC